MPAMFRPRIGCFLIYWGLVALAVFLATMVNNRPEACPLLAGVGLVVLGLLVRVTAKPAAPPPAPAPAKQAAPAQKAAPPAPKGLKAIFKLPGKKK